MVLKEMRGDLRNWRVSLHNFQRDLRQAKNKAQWDCHKDVEVVEGVEGVLRFTERG